MKDSTTAEVNGFMFDVEFDRDRETGEVDQVTIDYKDVDIYEIMARFAPSFIDEIDRRIGDAIRRHKNGS